MSFFRIFKEIGLSTATVQREGITHTQVSNLFWINVGVSGLVSMIVAVSAPAIAWFYREPRLVAVTIAFSITFLLNGATVQHMALLARQMRFKVIALIQVGSMVAGVAVGIGMAWLECGYWSLVGMQVSTVIVTFLMTWWASRWRPQFPKRRSGTRPLLSFGVNLAAGEFVWSIARGTDGLLIGRFWGADSVGLYSRAGALLMRPILLLMFPIESVVMPMLSRLQSQPERYRRTFLHVYEAIALVGAVLTSPFLVLAHPLTLVVLGPKWEKAAVIFAAFTIASLCYVLTTVSTWLFASQGRGRESMVAIVMTSCLTVVSYLVGLPFGPVGVAIAFSLAGLVVQMPILFYMAGRHGPVTMADQWTGFLRHVPVWAVVCGVTYLVRRLVVNSSPLMQLAICAPIGLLAGSVFTCIYAPARTVALTLFSTLREWKRGAQDVAGIDIIHL
jgi:PST family polysaccharide transporter